MTRIAALSGQLLTPAGFVGGTLRIHDGRIAGIDAEAAPTAEPAPGAPLVLPGFIDLHVHGGGGRDVMDGGVACATLAALHARHGTTSLLATTMTAPAADLEHAFAGIAAAMAAPAGRGARLLGVHLEGPFISAQRLGAQPDFVRPPDLAEVRRLDALAPIRLITIAPELPGMPDAIAALAAAGFRLNIGHSNASYDACCSALAAGADGFTHLFNAMSALHHRAPGAVGAALAHAAHAEIIPDLLHVHPGAIRAALRAIPGLYCVSDGTAATGMPDGDYMLGRQHVTKCLGGVRLADGTLAGSTLTLDVALRNLVDLGLPLMEAARRVSTFAADRLGLADRGRLVAGAHADIVVLDAALHVQRVITEGVEIALDHAI